MGLSLGIDHAVVAVRELERAAAKFAELGFTLTPRGEHSIGSRNHCIMLGSTYIELLAAPVEHPWLAYFREFLRQGDGLAAIALATDDADRTYAELKALGVAAEPPMDLSRPVEGGVARFRLVQIEPRLFVCQHLTRELVWRAEWQRHANGARELAQVRVPWRAPFAGLPSQIAWESSPALALQGLGQALQAPGVALEPYS